MPELPEVETVMMGLKPALEGHLIKKVQQNRPNLRYDFPRDFINRLEGKTITTLSRRAKYILAELDSDEVLIIHLGMSGRVGVTKCYTPKKHDHVVLFTEAGDVVTYNDARRFGSMDLCAKSRLHQHKSFADLGPEPLGDELTLGYLQQVFQNKNAPIKVALLDQSIVAGLGNIYVCEALWLAHIHPTRAANSLSREELSHLLPAIRQVLTEAIAAGGSTLRDHKKTNGEMGYFQHQFKVYGREGKPCNTCGAPIWRMSQGGRSTFYCSGCQL